MSTEKTPTGTPDECLADPDVVVDFLLRLSTCHNCGRELIVDFSCRHCEDGCPSSCEDCDEPHDEVTSRDYARALIVARQQAEVIRSLKTMVEENARLRGALQRDSKNCEHMHDEKGVISIAPPSPTSDLQKTCD